jgi:ATP-binding cassette, subfamily C (CFTR/MRP), member 10
LNHFEFYLVFFLIKGGGKSAFLLGLTGNLKCTEGHISIENGDKGYGYVSQNPWLQRGTIRENILWGRMYDEIRYKSVLHACALDEDLVALGSDRCGIGEAGYTLSGGQRVRVALARAMYQDKDGNRIFYKIEFDQVFIGFSFSVYLLDNVLSALDAHVALHIIKYSIFGLLKNKTRIIVTEHVSLLNRANKIYHIENGKVELREITEEGVDNNIEDDLLDSSVNNSFVTFAMNDTNTGEDQRSIDSVLEEVSYEWYLIFSTEFLLFIFARNLENKEHWPNVYSLHISKPWVCRWPCVCYFSYF